MQVLLATPTEAIPTILPTEVVFLACTWAVTRGAGRVAEGSRRGSPLCQSAGSVLSRAVSRSQRRRARSRV